MTATMNARTPRRKPARLDWKNNGCYKEGQPLRMINAGRYRNQILNIAARVEVTFAGGDIFLSLPIPLAILNHQSFVQHLRKHAAE